MELRELPSLCLLSARRPWNLLVIHKLEIRADTIGLSATPDSDMEWGIRTIVRLLWAAASIRSVPHVCVIHHVHSTLTKRPGFLLKAASKPRLSSQAVTEMRW